MGNGVLPGRGESAGSRISSPCPADFRNLVSERAAATVRLHLMLRSKGQQGKQLMWQAGQGPQPPALLYRLQGEQWSDGKAEKLPSPGSPSVADPATLTAAFRGLQETRIVDQPKTGSRCRFSGMVAATAQFESPQADRDPGQHRQHRAKHPGRAASCGDRSLGGDRFGAALRGIAVFAGSSG